MGIRDKIQTKVAKAFDTKLADAVNDFTGSFVIQTGWDPVTETGGETTVTYTGRGVLSKYSLNRIDGVNILHGDLKLTALTNEVTATVTFVGLGWDSKADDTSYITGTPADNAGELRYSFKEVTAINLNGIDGGDGFCIDTFNIQFDNNVQTQRCIGTGSPFAGANIPTTFTPSGSITLSWSKAAWEVWSKTLTGATVPFSFTLANEEGQYTFNFPKVQVAGDWPDGGNTDIIQVQLDITAADESPTITRAVTYSKKLQETRREVTGEAQAEREAAKAHDEQRAALQRLVAQLDPVGEGFRRLAEQQKQLDSAKSSGLLSPESYTKLSGTLGEMRTELEKTQAQLGKTGMSAKQTAFAMRMIPAQMTDIVVGLSNGVNNKVVIDGYGLLVNLTNGGSVQIGTFRG